MRQHILVIHRWKGDQARYADYVDHDTHAVSYVTTELGVVSVPAGAAGVELVRATDDLVEVARATDRLVARLGPVARVVALNEGDLDTAALLRQALGIVGQQPDELARFRDKLTMVETVARAGLPTPAYADAPDADAVRRFADEHGWPVIVKPRRGTASRDVVRLDGPQDLYQLDALPVEPRLVETFCPDTIYHVDGLWTGSELGPWRASRYINTCVAFTHGVALGSAEVDDPRLLGPIGEFTAEVGRVLGPEPWVFHLEVFAGERADGSLAITFLEAGYRVGGAEIPFVWRDVHGVDLMSAAVAIQLGRQPALPALPDASSSRVAGWLLIPSPAQTPCRVSRAELTVDPALAPYASVMPEVGWTIPKVGGYEHVGARFRFVGASTAEVEKSVVATAAGIYLEGEHVPERPFAGVGPAPAPART